MTLPLLIRDNKGFTLIEILVSMVILAIGLLGLGSLLTLSIKDSQNALAYSQAMALTYEMADRIHANAVVWKLGTLPAAATDCSNNCNSVTTSCTAADMAAYDYCVWKGKAKAQMGAEALATVNISPVSGSIVCAGSSSLRCLTLTWINEHRRNSKFELELQP